MSNTIRIVEMPDLGVVNDSSSVVGERAGSGRFAMPAVRTYMGGTFATQAALNAETAARIAGQGINVREHGALGNGTTNDSAAFNAALNAASSAGGGLVVVPIGAYRIDPINIPENVALCGMIPGPPDAYTDPLVNNKYCTLLANSTGTQLVFLNTGSSLQDVLIHYPQQVLASATTPNVYPAAIYMADRCYVRRVTTTNAYIGIDVRGGRSLIEDCKIGAFYIGIDVDTVADYTYIDHVMIEPFWDTMFGLPVGQPIDAWVLTHGVGINVSRADALSIASVGVLYRYVGIQLTDGASETPPNSYGHMADIDLDTVQFGIVARSTDNAAYGWQIIHCNVGSCDHTGTPGQAAVALQAGGANAPTITWLGGSVRGTWASAGGYSIAAGVLNLENVRGMTGTGYISTPPAVPASSSTVTNPYPYRCGVYPTGFNQMSINGNQTGAVAPGYMEILPGQTIGVAYSGTPSWKWFSL
jgi:hypothetical protein